MKKENIDLDNLFNILINHFHKRIYFLAFAFRLIIFIMLFSSLVLLFKSVCCFKSLFLQFIYTYQVPKIGKGFSYKVNPLNIILTPIWLSLRLKKKIRIHNYLLAPQCDTSSSQFFNYHFVYCRTILFIFLKKAKVFV